MINVFTMDCLYGTSCLHLPVSLVACQICSCLCQISHAFQWEYERSIGLEKDRVDKNLFFICIGTDAIPEDQKEIKDKEKIIPMTVVFGEHVEEVVPWRLCRD